MAHGSLPMYPMAPMAPAAPQPRAPAVAIVTPQRSNSLDFLNFEEKRQLIASSLSLSDFLNAGPGVVSVGKGLVGEY